MVSSTVNNSFLVESTQWNVSVPTWYEPLGSGKLKTGTRVDKTKPTNNKNPIDKLWKAIKEALPRQNPIFTEKTIRRIFQALRIEVNDELNEITFSLNSIKKSIKKKGIILCISYHSLEDKIVKKFFDELTTFCICEPSIPICKCDIEQQFSYPGKKKYLPTEKEKESNPRSKSAIMRYVVKLWKGRSFLPQYTY